MLEPEEIKKFQEIIKVEHGEEMTEAEATVMAKRLLLLYELIHRKTPSEIAA